jgi:uncharacterized membrane protein YecN with MAPEG domain
MYIVLELVAGLFFPRFAFITGVIIIIGRQLYSSGYRSTGAAGRNRGGGIAFLAAASLLVAVIYGTHVQHAHTRFSAYHMIY